MPRELLDQFTLAEDALRALGVVVWPLVEWEADDGLGTAAARWADEPEVERVVIMTPDKDMGQCVREDGKVVQYDRRQRLLIDADGVRKKFGVSPESIPDLPRARRRLRRRLSGHSGLGQGLGGCRSDALRPPRGHSRKRPRLGHQRPWRRAARDVAARAPRRGVPVPRARDARHRRAARPRVSSTTCAGGARIEPSSRRSPSASGSRSSWAASTSGPTEPRLGTAPGGSATRPAAATPTPTR